MLRRLRFATAWIRTALHVRIPDGCCYHFPPMIRFLVFLCAVSSALTQAPPKSVYSIEFFPVRMESQDLRMAYRDVKPTAAPNGHTVVLLHGKNFSGFYWERVIGLLVLHGFRVIAPDQIGFGQSSRPDIHYSFQEMAATTKALLDHLGIERAVILGHSMGGMLATRFALMYPASVEKLVLEDPIGLEDYRTFVPHASVEQLYAGELKATQQSFLNYQKGYYTAWKPEYEPYVEDQAWVLGTGEYPRDAWASALTSEMIYEQPVCYEFSRIQTPALLIIGREDRTVPGKARLSPEMKKIAGDYPKLAAKFHEQARGSQLVEISNCGHIPHIEQPQAFDAALLKFLAE